MVCDEYCGEVCVTTQGIFGFAVFVFAILESEVIKDTVIITVWMVTAKNCLYDRRSDNNCKH